MKRRERTRQLIELGGLIAKAGLIELTNDDRPVIFGMLVEAADKLRGENREQNMILWRRKGRREFNGAGLACRDLGRQTRPANEAIRMIGRNSLGGPPRTEPFVASLKLL